LVESGIINKHGSANKPTYTINYPKLLFIDLPEKILEYEERAERFFNIELINWLNQLSGEEIDKLFGDDIKSPINKKMTAKELEYLTIELSWKSSALEGNTYTLLDTQLLLLEGIKAKNRTEFETQMILNHKNAIAFIVENIDLFGNNLTFRTVEELHKIIGFNLGIQPGIRKIIVQITASNYQPLSSPQLLRENADRILSIINKAKNPFSRAILALSLFPYLQAFEDGNKRTGRMLANALLINSIGIGFSLRKTEAKKLALAYLSFYEFNSIKSLQLILKSELLK
jgi:Fic family protein